jgi:hypothetical protein
MKSDFPIEAVTNATVARMLNEADKQKTRKE